MNKDNRISNLPEVKKLLADSSLNPFPDRAIISETGNADSEALFLVTRSGRHNEKITYKNLKNSVLDNAVFLTGNQLISGKKTFSDICTFQDTVYINEIIDITETGDISGNIFVGESGLFEKMGIGLNFTDRRIIKDVFSDFPSNSGGYLSFGYGGGIEPQALSSKTYNYSLISGDGIDYTFSGDAIGADPQLNVSVGDSLVFSNLIGAHALSIKDLQGNVLASESSAQTNFTANTPGTFFYQCSIVGHENMSGNINVSIPTGLGVLDFDINGLPDLSTSLRSYPIYKPSGYFNSSIPQSQQNWGSDLSLDGHSLLPNEIHREMGGAWYQIDFDKEFNYKGFSLYRGGLSNSAENLKVVASNNKKDWRTIHRVTGLTAASYNNPSTPSSFPLVNYYPDKYSSYRIIAEKIISGDFWEVNHFSFSGVEFFEHVHTENPMYTLHVSGDSCFLGDTTTTGDIRQVGNLLRIGDSSLVGDFVVTGDSFIKGDEHFIGDKYQTGNILQIGDSYRSGDSFIRGQVSQVGNCYYTGDSWRLGDSTLIGDKKVTGDFYLFGEFSHTGDTFIKGDFFQSGNSFIEGDQTVTGDIYLGEYLYHLGDKDTYLRFTDDKIDLTAGSGVKLVMTEGTEDLITFFTSGEEQMRLTNQGFLGINTQDPIGELSVTGDSYLECVFTTGEDGKWERVFPGSDEVVSFVTALKRGSSSYKIDFPKTFGQDPAVSVSLENNQGASISPYFISGVTQSDFYLNFGTVLGSDGYRVHTSVRPTGQSAVNKTTTQSFKTNLPPGKDSYEIFFPNSFHRPPVVSSTIETSNLIMPHLISGISQNSYHILFGSTLPITYKIHTHAVR